MPLSESSWPKEAARHDRVLVVLATPVSGCFDYLVPPHLSVVIGSVVVAPFGNRRLPGIVLGSGTGDVAVEKLRYLEEVAAVATFCLLYTSPSPRDYAASRMPSSA